MMDEVKCSGCNKETDSCRCQELVVGFNKTNQYLYDMDLLDRLAGFTLTNLIQERIDTHVQDTCKGILDTSHINDLLQVSNRYDKSQFCSFCFAQHFVVGYFSGSTRW